MYTCICIYIYISIVRLNEIGTVRVIACSRSIKAIVQKKKKKKNDTLATVVLIRARRRYASRYRHPHEKKKKIAGLYLFILRFSIFAFDEIFYSSVIRRARGNSGLSANFLFVCVCVRERTRTTGRRARGGPVKSGGRSGDENGGVAIGHPLLLISI